MDVLVLAFAVSCAGLANPRLTSPFSCPSNDWSHRCGIVGALRRLNSRKRQGFRVRHLWALGPGQPADIASKEPLTLYGPCEIVEENSFKKDLGQRESTDV